MSVGALYLGAGVIGLAVALALSSLPVAYGAVFAVMVGLAFLELGL